MNIFVTDDDPVLCAYALDDKRVNKMFLESLQMLCTAICVLDYQHWQFVKYQDQSDPLPFGNKRIYKPTHKNHPCNIWVREKAENFLWLMQHAEALHEVYEKTSNRIHKSMSVLNSLWSYNTRVWFPSGYRTPFPNCARNDKLGLDFTHIKDVHEAYRQYLKARWPNDVRPPTWKERDVPSWMLG